MSVAESRSLFYSVLSDAYRLSCIGSLLGWDQQVYMPPAGAQARADQIQHLALMIFQKVTDPAFMAAVDELHEARETLSEVDQVNVRETKRGVDRQRKLPPEFVSEKARAHSLGYNAWVKARPNNDFEAIKPLLEKNVELARREADLVGYEAHPYDALLDSFEPHAKIADIKPLLLDLSEHLRVMIPEISDRYGRADELSGHFDQATQFKLCRRVVENMGYSFETGRLDSTAHPFMTTIGPSDARITTRFNESNFLNALYATIHETGHALYELGLPVEHAGTPMASAVSMGIHESQSRLWENMVGRSRPFSVYAHRVLGEFFPDTAKSLGPNGFWRQANRVKPELLRVEADEVTYSQHVVIRMLLEERLVTGDLSVADLPGAWDDLYEKYLGIRPTDFKNGVMQDVHWYSGAVGYFPSYALGNLYNSMMMETARAALPSLDQQIESGEFAPLLAWLRENVHRHGMRFRAPELIKRISGRELSAGPFVEYLKSKFLQAE